jgi:iron complex transport system ATP-binding protein
VSVFALDQVSVVRPPKTLLDDITWSVEPGQHWVVFGPNGAGKTTLLQIVGASMFPTRGRVELLDEVMGEVSLLELRTRIGHVSSKVSDQVPPSESARKVVMSAAHAVFGVWREEYDSDDVQRADEMMAEMGVDHLAERTFGTLSDGEKKRVLICRALMTDPEFILLDEPGAGLDLGAREDLVESLEMLASDEFGPSLVLVSHHVEEIAPGFTHALILRDGRIVASGPIAETLTSATLSEAFDQPLVVERVGGRFTARRAPAARRAF